jgi:hypothetical protein
VRRPEAGVAGASRGFPQKLGAAGLRTVTDIAGERRAPDAGREHDGAVVERGELRPVADAARCNSASPPGAGFPYRPGRRILCRELEMAGERQSEIDEKQREEPGERCAA